MTPELWWDSEKGSPKDMVFALLQLDIKKQPLRFACVAWCAAIKRRTHCPFNAEGRDDEGPLVSRLQHAAVCLARREPYSLRLKKRRFSISPEWKCNMLREYAGNIYVSPPSDDELRTWLYANNRTLLRLLPAGIKTMPVLADALEEAGCTNSRLLSHLRRPNGHRKGCWSLRLLNRAAGRTWND